MTPSPLPDDTAAFDNLFARVHHPVFFEKLAAAGFVPQTEAQAQTLLEMGAQLDAVAASPQVKQAEAANDPIQLAKTALDSLLAANGFATEAVKQAGDVGAAAIRRVAQALAADPAIYNSVLTLKAAEAAEYQAQFAG